MVLTSKVNLVSLSVPSRMVFPRATPALLMRMVGLPHFFRMAAAAFAIWSVEVISHLK